METSMRSLLKVGLALLGLAVLLIGASYSMLRAQGVARPSNTEGRTMVSEKRVVGAGIREVDVNGPIDMTLRQGAVPSLIIRGEQRLLGNIDTSQEGAILHLGTKGMVLHHRQPLQAVLVLPQIDAVTVRGSGDSTINGFSGERVEVQLNGTGNVKFNGRFKEVVAALRGSGDMELNGGASKKVAVSLVGSGDMTVVGSSEEFTLDQTGSGDVDAEHLAAGTAEVSLLGSGTAVINAAKSANVTLRGSGDVTVLGSPGERNVSRTGSGEVDFR